jgi:hypothetical protein
MAPAATTNAVELTEEDMPHEFGPFVQLRLK